MGHPRLPAPPGTGRNIAPLPAQHGFGRTGEHPPDATATCTQVHGATVLVHTGADLSDQPADAIVTAQPGAVVGIRTADCLPMLFSSADGRVVAAVHAGWRGTVAGVGPATVALLERRFKLPPGDLFAAFGPCIRPCCYQVGGELIEAVQNAFPHWHHRLFSRRPDGRYFDLAQLNRLQLQAAGVVHIDDDGQCTCCQPDRYPSYRRDAREAGRMVSWVRATPVSPTLSPSPQGDSST